VGGGGRLPWRELGNKLAAFEVFRRAELLVRTGGRDLPLAALVERDPSQGPGRRVFALEGIGYGHAERRAGRGLGPRHWLAADTAGLAAGSLIALHCGIGLSLARRRLAASARAPAAELRRGLAGYVAACRDLAPPDHAAPLLEALGFIACLRLARRAGELAGALSRLDEEAHAFFWHGWGRALYFRPGNVPPWAGTPRRLIAAVKRGAPLGGAQDNALAGLAWAVTMVNLRYPQALEGYLRRQALQGAAAPGFAHGVSAAILVRHECAPDDPSLASWRRHRPHPNGGEMARLWGRQVSGPVEAALARGPGCWQRAGGLGDLFRIRSASSVQAVIDRPAAIGAAMAGTP
jgi:hypothetical protein